MNIKCKLEFHSWNGCKCTECGKIRDEQHDWYGCKCSICGTVRDKEHNWYGNMCKECRICGKTQHEWHGYKCHKCDEIRKKIPEINYYEEKELDLIKELILYTKNNYMHENEGKLFLEIANLKGFKFVKQDLLGVWMIGKYWNFIYTLGTKNPHVNNNIQISYFVLSSKLSNIKVTLIEEYELIGDYPVHRSDH